jgi:hypothetical protein
MRVKVFNRYETPGAWRVGTIIERSWGRDRGKPIYHFTVKMDDVDGHWVFDPGQLFAEDHKTS